MDTSDTSVLRPAPPLSAVGVNVVGKCAELAGIGLEEQLEVRNLTANDYTLNLLLKLSVKVQFRGLKRWFYVNSSLLYFLRNSLIPSNQALTSLRIDRVFTQHS